MILTLSNPALDLVLELVLILPSGVQVAYTLILILPDSSLSSSMAATERSILCWQSQNPHLASWLHVLPLLPELLVLMCSGLLLRLLVGSCVPLLASEFALS